jgi:hypothetical protein
MDKLERKPFLKELSECAHSLTNPILSFPMNKVFFCQDHRQWVTSGLPHVADTGEMSISEEHSLKKLDGNLTGWSDPSSDQRTSKQSREALM